MENLGIILLIMAFIFEGLVHGMRNAQVNKTQPNSLLADYGKYWHSLNVVFLVLLYFGISQINDVWWIEILYAAGMRFCVFDYSHNLTFGVNIFYRGETSITDRILKKFMPEPFMLMLRAFIIFVVFMDVNS